MARKPCAQDLPKLKITPLNCGCPENKGRFSRIARNAILPFYYDCSGVNDPVNNLDDCNKVFYIKNPKFFAGAAKNNPGSMVTQAMRYSHLARSNSRHVDGRPRSVTLTIPPSCADSLKGENWYKESQTRYEQILAAIGERKTIAEHCVCRIPWNVRFNSTSSDLANV